MKIIRNLFFLTSVVIHFSLYSKDVRVLSGQNLPPYVFYGNDDGLDNKIVKTAFNNAGINVHFVKVPFMRVRINYLDKEVDCSSSVSVESKLPGTFSEPYITYYDMVYKLKENNIPNIKSPKEMTNYSVLAFQDANLYLGEEYAEMTVKNKRYKEINDQKRQIEMLLHKDYDYIVGDKYILNYWYNNSSMKNQKKFSEVINEFDFFKKIQYRVVCKDKKFTVLFNKGLKKLNLDGTKSKIYSNLGLNLDEN